MLSQHSKKVLFTPIEHIDIRVYLIIKYLMCL
jgi:hypothetical protein